MLLALLPTVITAWTLDTGARLAGSAARASTTSGGSILDVAAAEQWCTANGLKERHLFDVYRHLFMRGGEFTAASLNEDAHLPLKYSTALCGHFVGVTTSKVVSRVPSEGGLKLVVELASGHRIETVLIFHDHESSGKSRCTVCVSSQVGCARACSFCATGTMGLRANLGAAEILEQVWHAFREAPEGYGVRNVVFMGMGEPLDNIEVLLETLRGLTHQALFGLSAKQLTVSTVGASPDRIRRLADVAPKVRLALSLHSADLPLRTQLIPSATSMEELNAALDYHAQTTRCGLMVEYLLIEDVNDRDCDADALAAFCRERNVAAVAATTAPLSKKEARAATGYVNLIPFNPTEAGSKHGYTTPSDAAVERFHARLRDQHGVNALIRWTSAAGRDANGACGQLVV
jgi:adenine C2-methylase RlmN of 23S rRNA A2503 and tRNA A37